MADLRPRINTRTNVLTSLIAPAGARNAAMLCTATWGPINEVKIITSTSNFVEVFGNDKEGDDITGIKGADNFFANGGTLKVVRLDDGTAAESSLVLQNSTTDVITLTAAYKGTEGDNISVVVSAIDTTNRGVKITYGSQIESYTNGGVGFDANEDIVAAINSTSNLVTAAVETGQETSNLVDVTTATYLDNGADGETGLATSDYVTAYENLLVTENFNFLLLPGITNDSAHASFASLLETRAAIEKRYSRLIAGVAKDETIATMVARTTSSRRCSLVAPSIKYTHRATNEQTILNGSYLACAYAGMLCGTERQVSGTHNNVVVEGLVVNEASGKEYYNKAEQSEILAAKVIPITEVSGQVQAVRGITRNASTTEVWFEEVVVDIIDYVREQSETYLNSVIGKPNTADNRTIYAARLDSILQTIKDEGIIEDFNESAVVAGASPDTINATLNVKPAYNTNFVNLTINVQ